MCSSVCYTILRYVWDDVCYLTSPDSLTWQMVAPSNGVEFHCLKGGQLSEVIMYVCTHTHIHKQWSLSLIGVVTTQLATVQ